MVNNLQKVKMNRYIRLNKPDITYLSKINKKNPSNKADKFDLTKKINQTLKRDSMVNVTLFSQILQHINRKYFTKVVEKYSTDKHNKGINSWTHLVTDRC